MLTKKPIRPSISARLRLAIGVPTQSRPGRCSRAQEHLEGGEQRHEQACTLASAASRRSAATGSGSVRDRGRRRADPAERRPRPVGRAGRAPARPASCSRQYAESDVLVGGSRCRCQAAKSAYWTGSSRQRRRRCLRGCRVERLSSRTRMPIDQPSETMWCTIEEQHVLVRAEAEQPRPAAAARAARSNGVRCVRGEPRGVASRSASHRRSDRRRRQPADRITWHRPVVVGGDRVRSASCRATTLAGAPRSAADVDGRRRSRSATRHVVGGAGRLELVEEPEPLLGEGERQRPGRVGARHDGRRRRPAGARRRRRRRGRPTVGLPRRAPQRQLDAERRCARRDDDLRGEQRVAAEGEEVVVDADPVATPSTSAQTPREQLLGAVARARRSPRGRRLSGAGSAPRSTLPLAVSGSASSVDERPTGTMYSGRPLRPGAQSARPSASAGSPDDVGDQPAARPSSRATTAAPGDARVARQRGLDLAELDAEAADLDLVVGAAEELERAVGAPAHQVAGAVQAAAGPPNGSATNRSAVSRAGRR